MEDLYDVTRKQFDSFLKGKNITAKQGTYIHSTVYEENNEVVAYMETSSYTSDVIYKIKDAKYKNQETLLFITKKYLL